MNDSGQPTWQPQPQPRPRASRWARFNNFPGGVAAGLASVLLAYLLMGVASVVISLPGVSTALKWGVGFIVSTGVSFVYVPGVVVLCIVLAAKTDTRRFGFGMLRPLRSGRPARSS